MTCAVKFVAVLLTIIAKFHSLNAAPQNEVTSQNYPPNTTTLSTSTTGHETTPNSLKFLSNQPFNDFDWNLMTILAQSQTDNFVVSPISVKLIIGMLFLGLKGTAAQEIANALKINSTSVKESVIEKCSQILLILEESKNNEFELNIGTKLFIDQSAKIQEEFQKNLLQYFHSTIERVDFKQSAATINFINTWCKAITKGKIKELINKNEAQDETIMMLVNAIYFRGEWEIPFPEQDTKNDVFWISNTKKVTVPTMTVRDEFWYFNATDMKSHIIRLPYAGKKYAMYVIAPYDVDGLSSLTNSLTAKKAIEAVENLKKYSICLHLPKFQFESITPLVPVLKQLGIAEAFNPTVNLEKIGSSPTGPLTISSILQKSGIVVNENGTVAQAATEVQISTRISEGVIDLHINHPFFFVIADEAKDAIVFTGKVVNPTIIPEMITNVVDPVLNGSGDISDRIQPVENEPVPAIPESDKNNYFDKEILKEVSGLIQGNVVLSPAGIKTALALILEGARGQTEGEIRNALRLPENKNISSIILQKQQKVLNLNNALITLNSHNRVFIAQNEKLYPQYQQTIKDFYNSEITKVNFVNSENAAKSINDWVNNVTEGLIPTLVKKDDFDATTRIFLANCIYFKGEWESEFDSKLTREDCFYSQPEVCQKSMLMSGEKIVKFFYSKQLYAKIVEIPFKDPRFSLVMMLPTKKDGVYNLLKDLQHQNVTDLFSHLRKCRVQLTIPRFVIDFSAPLSKVLQLLNIREVFSAKANLSQILDSKNSIFVKDVIHRSKIEINEKGAKAAASTGVQVVLLSAPMVYEFKANYPFVFFIRDTEIPGFLFEGILINPGKVNSASTPVYSDPKNISVQRTYPYTTKSYSYQLSQDKDGVNYPMKRV